MKRYSVFHRHDADGNGSGGMRMGGESNEGTRWMWRNVGGDTYQSRPSLGRKELHDHQHANEFMNRLQVARITDKAMTIDGGVC